jgi:hypothetical protein
MFSSSLMLDFPQVWKARLRTRDLLGIMNCVQCNVCRLHGKVASLGLGVAFQVKSQRIDKVYFDLLYVMMCMDA